MKMGLEALYNDNNEQEDRKESDELMRWESQCIRMRIWIEQQLEFNWIESHSGKDVFWEPAWIGAEGGFMEDCQKKKGEDFGTNVWMLENAKWKDEQQSHQQQNQDLMQQMTNKTIIPGNVSTESIRIPCS